jgi:Domain of unknown function (DUF1844)
MNETHSSENNPESASREEMLSALFGQLVMQQANMAAMLMGKVAHPDSGKTFKDIEAARLFIDELEMLETKTRGNLTQEEAAFLKQTLMNLRLSFVEAVEASPPPEQPQQPEADKPAPEPGKVTPAPGATAAGDEEHHKKFSKKY